VQYSNWCSRFGALNPEFYFHPEFRTAKWKLIDGQLCLWVCNANIPVSRIEHGSLIVNEPRKPPGTSLDSSCARTKVNGTLYFPPSNRPQHKEIFEIIWKACVRLGGFICFDSSFRLTWLLGLCCTEQYCAHYMYIELLRHLLFAPQIFWLSCNRRLQMEFIVPFGFQRVSPSCGMIWKSRCL
jgi:hypothetical protein